MPVSKGKGCVSDVMGEFKRGTLHSGKSKKIVKSKAQAQAIALSVCSSEKENLLAMGYSEEAIDLVLTELKERYNA